jgi:hypothetical protein
MSDQNQTNQENPSEDAAPSLFDEASESGGGIELASEDVWVIKDLGRPAGALTDAHIVSHPNGLYLVRQDNTQVANSLFDEAKNGHDPNTAIFGNPQHVVSKPSGKLFTAEGRYVGTLLDYTGSPIDTTRDNAGNIRLVQERNGSFQLTSTQNNSYGANIKGHFDDARAEGDMEMLEAIVHYLWFAYRDEISILEGGRSFQAHSDRTRALKGMLVGSSSSEEQGAQSSAQTSLRGV